MHTMLIWVLINLSTGRPMTAYAFPTQPDCLRAASALSPYQPHYTQYHCQSMRVINPYRATVTTGASERLVERRALRNYRYEQQQMKVILQSPMGK